MSRRSDAAIMSLLMDPMRMNRLQAAVTRSDTDDARSHVGTIVTRAALTLRTPQASFTLLGVGTSTIFAYGTEETNFTITTTETYCQYTLTGEPFRVTNAKKHPLVCHMGVTASFDVGSYLGVPVTFAGYVLGALCVLDHVPREWTDQEQTWLVSLAAELTEWWKS